MTRAKRQQGAAMLIVMLVLLMATAIAVFSVHATSYEIRAAGHMRRAMQTQHVAESGAIGALAWVDRWGPPALLRAMTRTSEAHRSSGEEALSLSEFHEPELADGKDGYRMFLEDLQTDDGIPIDRETLGGGAQAYDAQIYVDVYDVYTTTRTLPGYRSDGRGEVKFMRATYTSRGRTRVAAGDVREDDTTVQREYHEGASDARAHGLSGPFGDS